jgi:DNA mismatch repair protein MLH3
MLRRAVVVRQVENKFIVAAVDDLILAIDQHAADERIVLEELSATLHNPAERGQHLRGTLHVPPWWVSLTPEELEGAEAHRVRLLEWGWAFSMASASATATAPATATMATATAADMAAADIAAVASSSSSLSSLGTVGFGIFLDQSPSVFGTKLNEQHLREYLAFLPSATTHTTTVAVVVPQPTFPLAAPPDTTVATAAPAAFPYQPRSVVPPSVQRVLNSRACRSAIMFGDELTYSQCRQMLAKLAECKAPFQCAHGRPTVTPLVSTSDIGRAVASAKKKQERQQQVLALGSSSKDVRKIGGNSNALQLPSSRSSIWKTGRCTGRPANLGGMVSTSSEAGLSK